MGTLAIHLAQFALHVQAPDLGLFDLDIALLDQVLGDGGHDAFGRLGTMERSLGLMAVAADR